MANQMIALGVRGPQLPDLGRAMSQYGAMMNTMAQQRASQRQAEAFLAQQQRLEQEMAFAQQQRAEQARAAGQTFDVAEMTRLRNLGVAVMGAADQEAAYQSWLGEVEKADPRSAAMFRQASPNFNPDFMSNVLMEAEQYINKTIPTPSAEIVYAPGGEAFEARVGGTGAPTAREVTVVPRAAPAQPTVRDAFTRTPSPDDIVAGPAPGAPVNARATYGADTGPQDLLDQGVNPASIPMGNPLQRPINFVPGSSGQQPVAPLTMETAPQIIQNAVQNRTIDESHLQQLRQMVGPENEQALAQWMQQNGVRIQPAGQPTMRSAVYRPGQDAAPQMTQVQQTVNAPGTQFRGRDPMQSPAPGESVPQAAERAGATSAASREPIPEATTRAGAITRAERDAEAATAYERERNTRQAQADVDFMQQYPAARDTVTNNLRVLERMIGDARVVNGRVTVPRGGRRPHPGFESVIGMGIPGMRFVPGSRESDFDSLFNQVTGAAFLEAFDTLKGGGQITEREGQVATQAITRLNRNISEVEFMEAANELRDIMQRGLQRAEARAARIEGRAPPPANGAAPRQQSQPRTRGGATVSNWPGGR